MNIVHASVGALPPAFTTLGGAIQRRVAELARAQARRDDKVTVFSPGEDNTSVAIDGVEVRYIKCRVAPPWAHLEYQLRVVAAVAAARRQPDVLHFHSEPEAGVLSAPAKAGIRVLSYDNFHFRGGKGSPLFPLYRHALKRFDLLLPCSEYCALGSEKYWDVGPAGIRVVYNGVNLEQFRPDPAAAVEERARLVSTARTVLLYLGRVCYQKGTDILLSAYSGVRRQRAGVQLVIAGPLEQFGPVGVGKSTVDWLAKMREAGACYLGVVPDDRLRGLLNMADVFVMPTRQLEMFGMAAVEAQACGTPVIASDQGGLKETVPSASGIRVPPGDSEALAAAIVSMVDNEDQRLAYAGGARRQAERFGWDRLAADLDSIYRDASASRAARHVVK